MNWSDIFMLSQSLSWAARAEAQLWGHPEIEVEHILLAVIGGDGAAGRMLRDREVTMDDARTAVEAAHDARVADLGVAPAPWVHRQTSDPFGGDVDWSPAAIKLLDHPQGATDDVLILRALLDEPTGFIVDVLARLGLDVDDLRAWSAEPQERPVVGEPGMADDAGWLRVTYSAFAPAEPGEVWALVSDPQRRRDWDNTTEAVVQIDSGVWHLHAARVRPDGRRARWSPGPRRSRLELISSEPGEAVEWETTWPHRRRSAVLRQRIRLRPARGGTTLEMSQALARRPGWRSTLRRGPAALQKFMLRSLLVSQAAAIVRAVSDS